MTQLSSTYLFCLQVFFLVKVLLVAALECDRPDHWHKNISHSENDFAITGSIRLQFEGLWIIDWAVLPTGDRDCSTLIDSGSFLLSEVGNWIWVIMGGERSTESQLNNVIFFLLDSTSLHCLRNECLKLMRHCAILSQNGSRVWPAGTPKRLILWGPR